MYRKDQAALTPPLGWNSWDCYGPAVNEEQLLGNAQYMADHLKAHGWEYVVCDIQWYEPSAKSHAYIPFTELCMDEYSRLLPGRKSAFLPPRAEALARWRNMYIAWA